MELKYKVIFFVDELLDHTKAIKDVLGREFQCFVSSHTDEYRQVFFQSGKFILLFSDAKKAVVFRQTPDENLFSLDYEILVYVHTDSAFKPDSQKILDQNGIKVFRKSETQALIAYVHKYLSGENVDLENDLEFFTPPDNPEEEKDKDGTSGKD